MAELSPAREDALRTLFAAAADETLMRLTAALGAARRHEPAYEPVLALAKAERADRDLRDLLFLPLSAFLAERGRETKGRLARSDVAYAWRLLAQAEPETVRALRPDGFGGPEPETLDRACLAAARLVGGVERSRPGAPPPDRLALLTRLLTLCPALRRARLRVNDWIRAPDARAIAEARLAFRDADALGDGCGRLFLEALGEHLGDPWRTLRLISAMLNRPTDRYLAESELAGLCEDLLAGAAERIGRIRRFDPSGGVESGAAAGEAARWASLCLREFEDQIQLARDGPWGPRVKVLRGELVAAVETKLRAVAPALAQALPLQWERIPGALSPRLVPRVDAYPDEAEVARAEGALAFLADLKPIAPDSGFGALRNRVAEEGEVFLAGYVDELVERLGDGRCPEPDWARALLDVAADFTGTLKGPSAGQTVRRRAAAAA